MRNHPVAILLVLVLSLGPHATPQAHAVTRLSQDSVAADVHIDANDDLDAYVGTGGLLLPSSFEGDPHTRVTVAQCLTCVWKYTLYCAQDSSAACAHAVSTCALGKIRYRVKFGRLPNELLTVGSVCWGTQRPATRADVNSFIREDALRRVPNLNPGYAPAMRSLVAVPIVAWSGQPSGFRPSPMTFDGLRVSIDASALWRWSWGDLSIDWTVNAGSARLLTGPTHQYRRPGTYAIDVETVWSAQYVIRGVGRFTVDDSGIHQHRQLRVQILPSTTRLSRGTK
jgi:hypothetical protein